MLRFLKSDQSTERQLGNRRQMQTGGNGDAAVTPENSIALCTPRIPRDVVDSDFAGAGSIAGNRDDSDDRRRMSRMLRVSTQAVAMVALSLLLTSPCIARADEAQKTAYIYSLNYDLNALLSVSLETTSMPENVDPFTRQPIGDGIIICRKDTKTARDSTYENALLNPSDAVYPGALVRLDEDLARGQPTLYSFQRAPLTMKVELPNGQALTTFTVDPTQGSTVRNAVETAVRNWLDADNGFTPQVRAFGSSKKAFSQDQIGVDLGFGAQWSGNKATARMNAKSTTESTTTIKAFTQIYYTVSVDVPTSPGAFFKESSPDLTSATMPPGSPPGYVSSVDYGRLMIMVMTTNSAETKINAEATLEYASNPDMKIDADLKTTYEGILQNSLITVLAIGGSAVDATKLFSGSGTDLAQNFDEVVGAGLVFNKANTGFPVSYTVKDVKSNKIAQMNTTTRYVEEDCEKYASGFIKLFHDGLFVAKFDVSWNQFDDSGMTERITWSSGLRDHNWMFTKELPGDAQAIRIDTYGESCGEKPAGTFMLDGVTRNCYKIWGTSCFPTSGEFDETCTKQVE